jgi:hypothetical protein
MAGTDVTRAIDIQLKQKRILIGYFDLIQVAKINGDQRETMYLVFMWASSDPSRLFGPLLNPLVLEQNEDRVRTTK